MKKSIACKHFQRPKQPPLSTLSSADVELEKATVSVQHGQPLSTTFESLYSSVADLLQPQFARSLCQKLENLIDHHTKSVLEKFKQTDLESMHFLRAMNECWRNNCHQLYMIRGMFLYLDRKYVLADSSIMSIWDLGISKFRHYFSINLNIQKRTVDEILNLIELERRGIAIDRALIKELLGMMSSLSLYPSIFEPRFIEETERNYKSESQRLVEEQNLPGYLKYVDRIIQEESERAMHYLEALTQVPLIETVERELIANHMSHLLTKGLNQLLDDMRMDDLVMLHTLLSRVSNGLQELCVHFNKHIKQRGLVIVTDPDRDKTMVQDLLEFKERMDRVVDECFKKEEKFVNTLKEAFESFINHRPNKPAELIAKYIDSKLRSGNKEATEDELEKILDRILVLFRFIHGKDVFEAFYKKDLAKRLLVNKSASVDAEKSMLSKLKQECGAGFTGKLEGMFKDIELSKDMMVSFKNYISGQRGSLSPLDLTVNVLTMGYWPSYPPLEVNLPSFLQKHQNAFEKFYTARYKNRRLKWQPNLSNCNLIGNFEPEVETDLKRHEIVVSLFQGLVLLLFNKHDELSYQEIAEATNIDAVELKRTIQSLACGKDRVIIKKPMGKDVNETDRFMYNKTFTAKLYRVRINQVQLKETQEEQSMTEERVFQDRQYQIDAAIVRIMKTRKSMTHTVLLTEVFNHLRFPIRSQDVKTRIESLIERDYLQRDQDNPQTYNYVA